MRPLWTTSRLCRTTCVERVAAGLGERIVESRCFASLQPMRRSSITQFVSHDASPSVEKACSHPREPVTELRPAIADANRSPIIDIVAEEIATLAFEAADNRRQNPSY